MGLIDKLAKIGGKITESDAAKKVVDTIEKGANKVLENETVGKVADAVGETAEKSANVVKDAVKGIKSSGSSVGEAAVKKVSSGRGKSIATGAGVGALVGAGAGGLGAVASGADDDNTKAMIVGGAIAGGLAGGISGGFLFNGKNLDVAKSVVESGNGAIKGGAEAVFGKAGEISEVNMPASVTGFQRRAGEVNLKVAKDITAESALIRDGEIVEGGRQLEFNLGKRYKNAVTDGGLEIDELINERSTNVKNAAAENFRQNIKKAYNNNAKRNALTNGSYVNPITEEARLAGANFNDEELGLTRMFEDVDGQMTLAL